MHCTSCGKTLPAAAAHCPFCGHKVDTRPASVTVSATPAAGGAPPPTATAKHRSCDKCGAELAVGVAFCTACGAAQQPTTATARRLSRSRTDRWISGLSGGLAEYLGINSTMARFLWAVVWLILTALTNVSLAVLLVAALYGALWLFVPAETGSARH